METACKDVNIPCSMVYGVSKLRTDDKMVIMHKFNVNLPSVAYLGVIL